MKRKDYLPSLQKVDRYFPDIAKEDIVVWKVFNIDSGDLMPMFFLSRYRRGRGGCIKPSIRSVFSGLALMWKKLVGPGYLHSSSAKVETTEKNKKEKVYKCIIPKGTLYYKTSLGYASRKLLVCSENQS